MKNLSYQDFFKRERRYPVTPEAKYRSQWHANLESLSNYPVLRSQREKRAK